MALGVWSPDGGGKVAASALALVTVLSMAASTETPRPADRGARAASLSTPLPSRPMDLALLAPASLATAPQTYQQLTPQQAQAANAAVPFSALPNPAAKAFKLGDATSEDKARALGCLTMAVYYEAASESDDGQAAVAQVVLNRLRHPLFPKTVCGVVFQGSQLPTGCQFTFTCDGSLGRRPSQAGWKHASEIAQRALDGYVMKQVGEATHYHTMWVVPYWQPTLTKLTQIGAHIFYRWSGEAGRPAAFAGQYAGLEPAPPPIEGFDNGASVQTAAAGPQPAAPQPPTLVVAQLTAQAAATAATPDPAAAPAPAAPPPGPAPKKKVSYFGDSNAHAGSARLPW
jgi:spore germination cell wall hydrolase CwlJ-like protein